MKASIKLSKKFTSIVGGKGQFSRAWPTRPPRSPPGALCLFWVLVHVPSAHMPARLLPFNFLPWAKLTGVIHAQSPLFANQILLLFIFLLIIEP